MGNLNDIRREIRAKRRQITGKERENLSLQTAKRFLAWLDGQENVVHIATFLSLAEEIDTTPLNNALWQRGYSLYLPYVSGKNQPLRWLFFSPSSPLKPDQAGILAPVITSPPAPTLDLVITPLVAFDDHGTRLGMGGGFYDRTFQGRITAQSPRLVGIAYPCQQLSTLPRRKWDVPLDACVVADQFFTFQTNNIEEKFNDH